MTERSFGEMIAYFNRRVAGMDINPGYKMELLGMVTALGFKHEKSAPQWIPCSERPPRYDETEETSEYLVTDKGGRVRHCYLDPYMPDTFVTVEEGMIVDAVAWRPAPEPYCKTESHEREVG
ncbi:MAG: hypothetical protein IIZ78_06320 [Clostridiales bacterium]|nr:hypothetical protein [Clostridiales bacterium]